MKISPLTVVTLGAALLLAQAAPAQSRVYLNVGDPAPALKPAKWLKGTPVATFEPGQVYVVEFWATWCNPCKENIPHLTELQKRYAGSVSVLGISVFESNDPKNTAYLKKVESFVKEQGDRMNYQVAVDGPEGAVGKAWMKAADEGGLPTSFIVGKDGKVAWIGHPKDLETVLAQVVEDKYDVAAARERRAKEVETTRPIREAMAGKEYAKAVKLMDAAIANKPNEARFYTYDRLVALFHAQTQKAIDEAEDAIEEAGGHIGAYQMVASIMASQKDLPKPAYIYGKGLIARALEKGEILFLFQAMGAEVNASLGDYEGAVAMQEKAVAAAETDKNVTPEFREFLKKNLTGFRAKLKAKGSPSKR